jgi:hypothetical protein
VRINEGVRRAVLFLGITNDKGDFSPYGTGFLLGKQVEGGWFIYLVTAKHVLDDMLKTKRPMVGRLNLKGGGAQTGDVSAAWQTHPTDSKCDVVVASFIASLDTFDFGIIPLEDVLTEAYMQEHDIGAGDQVFTVGLLLSHFGRERNVTVVRAGNIAAMPEEHVDLGDKLGHQEAYLVESRSIGGLSGSPVFLQTLPFRIVKGEVKQGGGQKTEYLIGVHIGLFETKASGDTINGDKIEEDIIARRERFLEAMSAGIGIVIPIQRAIEIIEGPFFTKQREDAMKRHSTNKNSFVSASAIPSAGTAPSEVSSSLATDENPTHREGFTHLLDTAARTRPQGDKT